MVEILHIFHVISHGAGYISIFDIIYCISVSFIQDCAVCATQTGNVWLLRLIRGLGSNLAKRTSWVGGLGGRVARWIAGRELGTGSWELIDNASVFSLRSSLSLSATLPYRLSNLTCLFFEKSFSQLRFGKLESIGVKGIQQHSKYHRSQLPELH